ncbi:MAG: cupin domain-containing protein [Armatimonadetes bacterium]|nr:cupin domain-containing protein [Armatimonadota bacterium]
MKQKTPKIVPAGSGLERQSVPGESLVFKLTGDETGGALDYIVCTVGPKSGPPLHLHHTQEETFHITKGRFKFQIADETKICQSGDFVYIPPGTPHAFVNLSDEPGEFIAVFTPGGTDKFFAEFGPMMSSGGPPDQEKIAALLEKHGMTLLGPPLSPE